MSLVRSTALFGETAFPIAVERVVDRTLMQKELHRHEYFEMLYVERGSLTNCFKGNDVVMRPGDVLIMKPYVLHVLDDSRTKPGSQAYCCSFLPEAVDSGVHSLEQIRFTRSPNRFFFKAILSLANEEMSFTQLRLGTKPRAELSGLFQQLRKTAHERTERGSALARRDFLNLLIFLAEQCARWEDNGPATSSEMDASVSRYQGGLRKALSYIHDHFDQPLTLKQVATMSGASETYFCRLFKHETGFTFLNYLNALRIERACVLLRQTRANAADICYQVGFSDYTHFGRQFKRSMGISPAAFRGNRSRNTRAG